MRAMALTLVALASCGGDYLDVDTRFSPAEEQAVREAATSWEIATGRRIDLVFGQRVDTDVTSFTSSLVRVTSRNPAVYDSDQAHNGMIFDGITRVGNGNARIMIVVDTLASAARDRSLGYIDTFRWVTTHELGHFLGVAHNTTGIMQATVPEVLSPCITVADAAGYTLATGEPARGCP